MVKFSAEMGDFMINSRFVVEGDSTYDISALEISHYIKVFSECYGKIIILDRICGILINQPDSIFSIERSTSITSIIKRNSVFENSYGFVASTDSSSSSYITKEAPKFDFSNLISVETFISLFRKRPCPEVYISKKLIYDHYGDESLKIKSLTFNSPLASVFDGAIKVVEYINNEKREHARFEVDMQIKKLELETQKLKYLQEFGKCYEYINCPKADERVKKIMINELNYNKNKIIQMNTNMGLKIKDSNMLDVLV